MASAAQKAAPEPGQAPATGARLVVEALEREGVRHVFGYPGGAIMPLYDALPGSKLQHILVRHEQAAALAADAYGRVTGEPGVCIATSGPGATNLVTGIANAFLDSVPMVAITGQVGSPLIGTDAFQEVDIFGITLPIVKHSYIVRRTADIPRIFAEAFAIARSGRPGPVLIDLPKDVATMTAVPEPFEQPTSESVAIDADAIARANALIAAARAPILYFGGGIAIARAEQALRDFAERTAMPSVATLKGLGAIPTDAPNFLGMLGMHGMRAANVAIDSCDLLICVGARFDDRATGKLDTFAPRAKVIHIDGDPAEIGKLRRAEVAIAGDLNEVLGLLTAAPANAVPWREQCAAQKELWAMSYDAPGSGIYAPALLKRLSEAAGDKAIFTCDVGQHQMWVAQHCRFVRPQAHLTSAGLGTMGYGVPAGVGALLAEPDATVITVSGDGSIMMNIQELATVRRYRLPLKIVLIDNSQLGMVRQWQELFFDENFSEIDLSDNPDFAEVARAFGIEAFTIDHRSEVEGAIERLLGTAGPILCHVRIDPRANVWPLVPPNSSNVQMMEKPE
ncbi:acetolactate synthase 2 catalytic subunit [Sphingosinicella sp. LY1275]|uniref:acetolactate synthase 2 catalytic subunit n=1 Tax=Sphingosinicella sp. LY1275 TaxID=3095379 RepID=UPI002ADEC79E|nr:acetolactate synthase 2 catalytic subunit [Sphingosinicella sp. LY1275]MEA1016029.1 acetolactate synthase 2 catalytic subunit [Sphingosinicella sp. LY1275]